MSEAEAESQPLKKLREPFLPHQISKLPKPTSKDNPKGKCEECGGWHGLPAVHLDYVGHAAATDRLLEVDPKWDWEPMALDSNGLPKYDEKGGLWIKLTVLGVTRKGYGHADGGIYLDDTKEIIGDAIRNAGMRFGMALDLWHKGSQNLDGSDRPEQKSAAKESKIVVNYADLSNFVMPYGNKEVKGKKLSDIKPEALSAACQYFVNKAKEDKKEIQGDMKVTLEACSKWLQQFKETK